MIVDGGQVYHKFIVYVCGRKRKNRENDKQPINVSLEVFNEPEIPFRKTIFSINILHNTNLS